MNYDPLNKALADATRNYNTYPSTLGAISEQLKEQYGEKGWIGKLATAMTGAKPDAQSGFAKGTPEFKANHTAYNTARKQIERWEFKGTQPKAANKERLASFGKSLEPIKKDAPPAGLTITVNFKAPDEKRHAARTREFTTHMPYDFAVQYINQAQPEYGPLFSAWFNDDDYDSEDTSGDDTYGEDGDYEADVTGVSAY